MRLSPREAESLLVHQAGSLAQKRLARGVRLNHPETVALIASVLQELVRDGYTVSQLMEKGRAMLGFHQVLPGVSDMIAEIQIEATFPDGTKLVTVHKPISRPHGDLELALFGSFLPVPDLSKFTEVADVKQRGDKRREGMVNCPEGLIPGELQLQPGDIVLNADRPSVTLDVVSVCDRPIQVGSHYHFIETNRNLRFDRKAALGMRLNIPAGTAVRFEPGEAKKVKLVQIGGNKIIRGGNGLCDGALKDLNPETVLQRVQAHNFGHVAQAVLQPGSPERIPRLNYAHTYGPTVGDKLRLGDTSLMVEVEKDFTVYGDECKFGGGKVLREGMGQAAARAARDTLDTVITNALIVDAITGIVKADVGIKDGVIVGIGKAGNPDVMNGVHDNLIVGACTEAIAGEGLILTAGALDGHVHFICPQLAREAIASGITTLFGGGTGPATGTNATTCTPGPNHIRDMLQSTDAFPLNFGFTGKGNSTLSQGIAQDLQDQITAGAMGLKLHEDWGTTPAAIDTCLRAADQFDIQVMIHTDTLNESACVEDTLAAFKGRTIHSYHSEGAGGGHAPDIMKVVSDPRVLPSSTNPTRPYTLNTIDEHLDMLMVCHHLDKNLKEDVSFAESRIRAETIAAEDILHDLGAISMIASDSQAMGRIGEVITRTWQTADKMKLVRGPLSAEKGNNDNLRVKRYVAKYTVNPAIAHGMSHLIGSVQANKMADLVLWKPAFFGAKPELVIKGGQIAWAQMGMPNASIPTPEPVKQRKMFGAYGKAVGSHSVAFVSKKRQVDMSASNPEVQAVTVDVLYLAEVDEVVLCDKKRKRLFQCDCEVSVESGTVQKYGLSKRLEPVQGCRQVSKEHMVLNDLCPSITVDPQSYKVHLITRGQDGQEKKEHLTCPPAARLALAQRYFLF